MRRIVFLLWVLIPLQAASQNADEIFHTSAKLYIAEKTPEAKQMLDDGIKKYPYDEKLRQLRDKIKEDEKKKEEEQKKDEQNKDQKDQKENKDNKDQNKDDKQNKDQQNKDQKDKEEKDKEKKEQEDQQKKEDQQNKEKDNKNPPPSVSDKLKEMKMSEDKAKMVLEAMKNQEVQYLQQNKRKATKPKSKGKPDW